jgi:hypothetical protein
MTRTPSAVLAELKGQHDTLRALMQDCERLADAADAGADVTLELEIAVKRLRVLFHVHNQLEEAVLRPLLLEADAFGAVRVDRMVDVHVVEHRVIAARLAGRPDGTLRDILATLRQHLAEEERHFLSERVLRDDLVTVEPGG